MNITSIHFKIMHCLKKNIYSISEVVEILNISEFKVKRYTKDLVIYLKRNLSKIFTIKLIEHHK